MTLALTIIAGIVGFICLAGIGANDVANSQAMAVGSGAISLRGAQILASIFEFLGAALVGSRVSSTVGSQIVDIDAESAEKYAWGMFAAIFSTAIWMFSATALKMPVSSTHSIIGALIGFQLVINDFEFGAENWYDFIFKMVHLSFHSKYQNEPFMSAQNINHFFPLSSVVVNSFLFVSRITPSPQ